MDKPLRVKFSGGREGTPLPPKPSRSAAPVRPLLHSISLTPLRTPRTPRTFHPRAVHVSLSSCCVLAPSVSLLAVVGLLKGYDHLVNLVLDEAVEYMRGTCDTYASRLLPDALSVNL